MGRTFFFLNLFLFILFFLLLIQKMYIYIDYDVTLSWYVYNKRPWKYLRSGCLSEMFRRIRNQTTLTVISSHRTTAGHFLSSVSFVNLSWALPWHLLSVHLRELRPASSRGRTVDVPDPYRENKCLLLEGCSSGWLTLWRSSDRQLECIQVR